MVEAIAESEKSVPEDKGLHPKVGAILANKDGEIVFRAHRGESGKGDHAEFLILSKANDQGYDLKDTVLFATLEPCTSRGHKKIPCAERISQSDIPKIYIGMLDPNPLICGKGETYLRSTKTVERFPSDLVKKIQTSNSSFVNQFKSEILPDNSLYVTKQISEIIISNLKRKGLDIDELPFDWDICTDDLFHYCRPLIPSHLSDIELKNALMEARGFAFDSKYIEYSYDKDTRGLGDFWIHEFNDVMRLLRSYDYLNRKTINVGIGNGLEGESLFKAAKHLTIVDIAPKSLELAKSIMPNAAAIVTEAEDLKGVQSASQDIYVSMRTYQSSYYNISRALRESYRVVRQGGLVIISIANGYLEDGKTLITGLVAPRSNFVDKNRPFELAEKIRRKLTLLRFEEVGIRTGLAEIYVYGRKAR